MSVYFIRCNNFVKIGYSNNVERRFYNIQTSNPYKLQLLYISDNYTENELHERFKKFRVIGEWFILDNEILSFIKEKIKNDIKNNNFNNFYTINDDSLFLNLQLTENICDDYYKWYNENYYLFSRRKIQISEQKQINYIINNYNGIELILSNIRFNYKKATNELIIVLNNDYKSKDVNIFLRYGCLALNFYELFGNININFIFIKNERGFFPYIKDMKGIMELNEETINEYLLGFANGMDIDVNCRKLSILIKGNLKFGYMYRENINDNKTIGIFGSILKINCNVKLNNFFRIDKVSIIRNDLNNVFS